MKKNITAVAAVAGSLLLVPVLMSQASAGGHMGGGHMGGGAHFGGGHMGGGRMGSIHVSGGNIGHMGGVHVGGGNIGHINGGRVGGAHIASVGGWGGSRWHSGSAWPGNNNWHGNNWHGQNWHGHNHDHDHFAHDHHRFNNRFVGVGLGWWPGYYGSYGYGGCAWLRRQAVITGSPYWWDRYYSCVNYY